MDFVLMRESKKDNFTVMSTYHLRDRNLSNKAKGLMSLILSLPDNWIYSVEGLASISSDGKAAIRAELKELEAMGYIEREQKFDENGKFDGQKYILHEKPIDESKSNPIPIMSATEIPMPCFSDTEKPHPTLTDTDKTYALNQPQININLNQILNNKKEKKEAPEDLPIQNDEIEVYNQALQIAEKHLGGIINSNDSFHIVKAIEAVDNNLELFDYIVGYCCNNGHTSLKYMLKVAEDWSARNVRTVEEAKLIVENYNDTYVVLKHFGLSGRKPVHDELVHVKRWRSEYGFSMEIILEAVRKTMKKLARPDFNYTEGILKSWKSSNIASLEDIQKSDEEHERMQVKQRDKPKFNNLEERNIDYDELERRLIRN
jgi:DnaD/phage-associated family protein